MHCAKKAKVESQSAESLDRLSSLPPELKVAILSKLNVVDAIRASILSSAWRNVATYSVRYVSHLRHITVQIYYTDSDINNLISSCPRLNTLRLKYFKGINRLRIQAQAVQVLEVKGSFEDFHLHAPNLSNVYVTLNKTKVADRSKNYMMQAFVSLTGIEALVMKRCMVALPQTFEGFKRLSVLNLKYIYSTDADIANLISSCPWLKTLHLKYFEGISCLRIQAPALQHLEVQGNFEDLHLHAPNLLYLTLDKTETEQCDAVAGDKKNYPKEAFVSLTSIELSINGPSLTYLSEGCLLTKPPGVLDRLRKVLGACSIFRNAPMLRELEIQSFSRPDDSWSQPIWDHDQTEIKEPTLHHLLTATITGFVGLEYEVDLVRLLLRWSPALEELKVVRDDEDVLNDACMCESLTKLLALPRASTKAKIIAI
ncbi:F-box/FBD/LRR-repeat protein At1g13570 [Oryza sativa Japonica Group]|uniref:F-box/FBD/LRR-repeat protein At1g13570 n=1 Tax=Oryza sativa subsp. japonica TaxID=39947 RepID=UPI0001C7DCCB|nr:F-box and FBD domain-containing protein [Oryza sativa Japonica Group]